MYEPSGHPNFAFLWPAIAAAAASETAAAFAKQFTGLAVGAFEPIATPPRWATPNNIMLKLKTVQLRDFTTGKTGVPTLLCAPFALHGAVAADLAPGHSLVAALQRAGLPRIFITDWRPATAEMPYLGIDDYLADLNVLVDDIGPPIDLIGLCQGGWMSLIYAARFPEKIRKLALVAAPIDTAASPSALSRLADATPLAMFRELVRLGDGIVPGQKVLRLWAPQSIESEDIRKLLQVDEATSPTEFAQLEAGFRDWYAWTLDLPGAFFLETAEKLYKKNELAAGDFIALGRKIDLSALKAPLFLLAALDDELVAPAQLLATARLVGTEVSNLRQMTVPGRHLGLFMGKRILRDVWPEIASWLNSAAPDAGQVQATVSRREH
jgi:poly(3-hydroxybutyrate) depolymerase